MSQFESKDLTCRDCGQPFIFTAGEQQFFANQDPPLSEPKRCKECRRAKKASRGDYGGGYQR
jgi:hypothetical protein